jgi:hypothetical protein
VSGLAAVAVCCAGLATAPPPLHAQGFLDQGVFVITRGGNEIGREDFAVRTTPGRQGQGGMQAVATVRYRDRDYRAVLELTRDRIPVSYQGDATVAGRLSERVIGQCGRRRCAVRLVTPAGEQAHEFPVPARFVMLDDETFDQFAFVPRPSGAATASIAVVRPRQSRLITGEIRDLGPDSVAIGPRSVPAEHYAVTLPGSNVHELWFSAAGDLLKVVVPGSGTTARRASLPTRPRGGGSD